MPRSRHSRRAMVRHRSKLESLDRRLLMAAGDPDLTFSGDGHVNITFAGSAFEARAVALRGDGKTIVAGSKGGRLAVVRLNVDGSIDSTFAGGGLFESAVAIRATDVAVQADNKIVLTAIGPRSPGPRFHTIRILPDGEGLDTSFDGDGIVTRLYGTDSLGGYCYANALAIQQDGKIVVGGTAYVDDLASPGFDFAVTRYNPDGSPDLAFGARPLGVPLGWNWAGMGGADYILDLAIDYHGTPSTNLQYGSIVAVGATGHDNDDGIYRDSQFAVARFRPDGTLDGSLDGDGKLTTGFGGAQTSWAAGVIIQPGGKIVAVGSMGPDSGDRNLALVRFNSDGTVDSTFGPTGSGGKVQQDLFGDDIAADCVRSFLGGIDVACSTGVAAFSADGVLESRFSGDGAVPGNASAGIAATGLSIAPIRKLVFAGGNEAARYFDMATIATAASFNVVTSEATQGTLNVIVARLDRLPYSQRIYINIGGTATAPIFSFPDHWDYTLAGITIAGFNNPRNYVEIAANQTFTTFSVTPINDTRPEGDETILISVAVDDSYDVGQPSGTELLIRDDDYSGPPVCNSSSFWFETLPQQAIFRFNQNVAASIGDPDFQITGPAGTPGHAFAYEPDTNTATLTFAAPLPDGNYNIRAAAAGITNAGGQAMASDAVLDFFVLAGDANRNRSVEIGDFSILASRFNVPGTFTQGDFNYSGRTEIGDFAILASKFNTTLPAAAVAAAPVPPHRAAMGATDRARDDWALASEIL